MVSNVERLYNFGRIRTGSNRRILTGGFSGTADFMQEGEAKMMIGKLTGGSNVLETLGVGDCS